MGYFADVYVLVDSRSSSLAIDFLNRFIPERKESADEYEIPQYSDNPKKIYRNASDVMSFLETNKTESQSIYYSNMDNESLNKHAMIFYTKYEAMIFGVSLVADEIGWGTVNEANCLIEMKEFFKTDIGYVTYEKPPENSRVEFKKKCFN